MLAELRHSVRSLPPDDQAVLAQGLSAQVLLLALYAKSLDRDQFQRDFSEERYSLLSVFDERGRLGVLIDAFGEMMITATDAQYDKGERSNGWHDVSRSHMRDMVIQCLMRSLSNAMQYRLATK